jgi:uncharacterized protein with PIN domain
MLCPECGDEIHTLRRKVKMGIVTRDLTYPDFFSCRKCGVLFKWNQKKKLLERAFAVVKKEEPEDDLPPPKRAA